MTIYKMKKILTYTELSRLNSFEERLLYLQSPNAVGKDTFGFDRYMNQMFYRSREWRSIRQQIILRDNGCDLGIPGYEIHGCDSGHEIHDRIVIHHMNPIEVADIKDATEFLLNPEYLITTTHNTHNAIHYGSIALASTSPIERRPNDTCLWKSK